MSWTFIIIIGVLVYIAYQLSQLNRGKKYELGLKVAEKSEQKIKEFFPHLFPVANEDMKEEIRDFVIQNTQENMAEDNSSSDERNDLAYQIYLGRYKIINDKINAESDPKEKERMQGIKNDISKELKEWDNKFDSMVDNGKISGWEKDFILWNFLKPINEQFPKRHFELDDYFDSRFGRMQLPKD